MLEKWASATRPKRLTVDFILWCAARGKMPRFRDHIDMLEAVPEAKRDINWLCAFALLCGQRRAFAGKCSQAIKKLQLALKAAGRTADFEIFTKSFNSLIYPYRITAHGYSIPFAHRDCGPIAQDVAVIAKEVAALGYETFITAGTLLGAMRAGAFIPHDDDVDMAVVMSGHEPKAVVAQWFALAEALIDKGLMKRKTFLSINQPISKIETSSGVEVDLFPAWFDEEGRYFSWPTCFGEISRSDIFPLQQLPVHGENLPAPSVAEKLLLAAYGPSWRIPDPGFAVPWARANHDFKDFLQLHRATLAKYGAKHAQEPEPQEAG